MAARRSKNQARRHGGNAMPGWAWLLIGLAIGALAFGFMTVRDKWRSPLNDLPKPDPDAQAPAPRAGGEPVLPEPSEKPKPKYDFYTLLPEKEVVIPDAELEARARAEAKATVPATPPAGSGTTNANANANANANPDAVATISGAPPPTLPPVTNTARYLIQAGAFKGQEEAEALKARIAMTGEIARVETAQIDGNLIYRVRLGPYPTASGLAVAKQALASHGIAAQAIRAK